MRMFNRKGVSEVVANVLIVLLVIVGVAVIWAVVKPTIQKASDSVQSDCFTVQVEPQSCTLSAAVPAVGTNPAVQAGETATVVIKRNPGAGSFENIEVVFEGSNQATERVATEFTSTTLDELETVTATALDPTLIPVKANVALKVNGQLCQMTALPVNCV